MDLGFFARLVFPRPLPCNRAKNLLMKDLRTNFSEMQEMQICFDVVPDQAGLPLAVDPIYKRGSFGCFPHRNFQGPCWWKPRSQRQWAPELLRNAAIRTWSVDLDVTAFDDFRDFAALDLAGTPLSTSLVLSDASNQFTMPEMGFREFTFSHRPVLPFHFRPSNCDSQGTYACQCGFFLG